MNKCGTQAIVAVALSVLSGILIGGWLAATVAILYLTLRG